MAMTLSRIKTRLAQYNWQKITWIIVIEIAIVMVGATFFLPGGMDLYVYYLPFAQGCLECGFTPYFSYWILWPLQFIPPVLLWPAWTAFTLAGMLLICRQTGVNPALLLLSFPLHGQIWLGQVDVLICLGLALSLLGKNPFLRGAGMTLAMIKPQYAALAVFFLLTREKQLIKTLVVPVVIFAVSLAVFGIQWPIEWLTHSASNLPPHHWRLAAADIWPVGVALIWVPFLFKERRERFEAGTIISVLASPVVGVYSYIVFLTFRLKKWWLVPLSYAWLIAFPFMEQRAMRFLWILPLVILGQMVYEKYKTSLPVRFREAG